MERKKKKQQRPETEARIALRKIEIAERRPHRFLWEKLCTNWRNSDNTAAGRDPSNKCQNVSRNKYPATSGSSARLGALRSNF